MQKLCVLKEACWSYHNLPLPVPGMQMRGQGLGGHIGPGGRSLNASQQIHKTGGGWAQPCPATLVLASLHSQHSCINEEHTYFLSGLFLQQPDPRPTPGVQISGLGGDGACLGCSQHCSRSEQCDGARVSSRGGPGGHAGQLCSGCSTSTVLSRSTHSFR